MADSNLPKEADKKCEAFSLPSAKNDQMIVDDNEKAVDPAIVEENESTVDSNEPVLGIDLGTTFSCVYVFHEGVAKIVPNSEGKRTTPSYVAFTDTECLIGQAAKDQVEENPTNTVYDVKRLMGMTVDNPDLKHLLSYLPYGLHKDKLGKIVIKVRAFGRIEYFNPEEISALLLMQFKSDAEKFTGRTINRGIITVPAYFNSEQRNATISAGELAGLNVIGLLNEPTAAALAFGINPKENDFVNVLIFDLGGGTHDVTVLGLGMRNIEVYKVDGDRHLGGEDFVNNLVEHCLVDIRKKIQNKEFDLKKDSQSMQQLRSKCEDCKIVLSSSQSKTINLSNIFGGSGKAINFKKKITRNEFVQLNAKLFDKAIQTVRNVLNEVKMAAEEIDEVVLVGGSTRIPEIQIRLKELFHPKNLCQQVHPDEVVAYGAALRAGIKISDTQSVLHQWVFKDVTTHTIGVSRDIEQIMWPLIKRGVRLPAESGKHIVNPLEDYQASIGVYVYEGEHKYVKDNRKLSNFHLNNITQDKNDKVEIELEFKLDENGVLSGKAKDLTSGKQASNEVTVTLDGSFTPEQMIMLKKRLQQIFAAEEENESE